jgi:two-component system, chemotaxis family, chemotaxis protein CheY
MMRILLVDQSEAIREIERTVLAELGEVTFVESADGADALHRFTMARSAEEPFDLVVLEASVPVLDGLALVARLRALDKAVPLAMVTGEAEKGRVIEAIRAGVNAYIVKPFTPDLLLSKVRAVLGRKKAAA